MEARQGASDYHIDVLHSFYSVPHRLIGRQVDVRLTHRMIEIFHNHERVTVHRRRGQRGGHTTVKEHMPKAHQRYGGMTPESLITRVPVPAIMPPRSSSA